MRDFWRSSGWHLLERRQGRLVVTDDLLRAYLRRPEMRPPEDAGANPFDRPAPEGLIRRERQDHGRYPRSQRGGRGSGPAVMDDGRHARE